MLKQIEAEGRPATRDEQAVLAKYVVWRAFPKSFDPTKDEYLPELRDLLSTRMCATCGGSLQRKG